MKTLHPLEMPLAGINLIEASAGTGKTYTITSLYLRLLLGLDSADHPMPPLTVDQILVVTFTEAATEEIRDRVRTRLKQMRDALFMRHSDDPLLAALLERIAHTADTTTVNSDADTSPITKHTPSEPLTLAFRRIDAALKMLDEAAIFTIHGFCHRMLQQHAFESKSLFSEQFVLDDAVFLQRAVRDFWRRQMPPLRGLLLHSVLGLWASPVVLMRDVQPLLHRQFGHIQPDISTEQMLDDAQQLSEYIQQLKHAWLDDDIPGLLQSSGIKANNRALKADNLRKMQQFCESERLLPDLDISLWSDVVIGDPKIMKKGFTNPQHRVFTQCSEVAIRLAVFEPRVRAWFLKQALTDVQHNLRIDKQQHQQLTPDDLLTRLYTALHDTASSSTQERVTQDNGTQINASERLAQTIAAQYPAVMIDEFQDTDPLQYGIFHRIYFPAATEEALSVDGDSQPDAETVLSTPRSLTMIGDPKQAIYGFRGADIFTYIAAKLAIDAQRRFTLDTNYRSAAPVVDSVNQLYENSTSAFMYEDTIPFYAVNAHHQQKQHAFTATTSADVQASVCIWHVHDEQHTPLAKSKAQPVIVHRVVQEICDLLTRGDQGELMLEAQPVSAGDIAILVRDRIEAGMIRDALRQAGVASVFITRQSVFDSALAQDMYRLLLAIYHENDERGIRAVLSGHFFALSLHELHQLTEDDVAWQAELEKFTYWRDCWQKRGVLALINVLIREQQLAQRWSALAWDHERLLTDLRHLGELLQQKSMELDGHARLLSWLQQQISEPSDAEGNRLRLENDQRLVNIVTWHAAKGLEYPIVFLPFVSSLREAKSSIYHDSAHDDALTLDLLNADTSLQAADQERLAEDLRLLYVALTRPVYRCYLGMYDCKVGAKKASRFYDTAMGRLLLPSADAVLSEALTAWQQRVNKTFPDSFVIESIAIEAVSELTISEYHPPSTDNQALSSLSFTAHIQRDWRVTSYSALSHGHDSRSTTHTDTLMIPGFSDEQIVPQVDLATYTPLGLTSSSVEKAHTPSNVADALVDNAGDQHHFPKGANAGSCLHDIFENISFSATEADIDEVVAQSLQNFGIDAVWQPTTTQWIMQCLQAPLALDTLGAVNTSGASNTPGSETQASPLNRVNLAAITDTQRLVEMEFHLPMQRITAGQLVKGIDMHLKALPFPEQSAPALHFAPVQGVLKGFIDLLFEHEGRYYVLDYKSNWLGANSDAYSPSAMHQAMLSHHYHLQYLLYCVAVDRFLAQRVPDYTYEQHMGGVIYSFLRGIDPQKPGYGQYVARPSRAVIDYFSQLFTADSNTIGTSATASTTSSSKTDKTRQSAQDDDNTQFSLFD